MTTNEGEPKSLWQSDNHSKRRGELFFIKWLAVWLVFFGAIVVTQVFETFTPTHYMLVGIISCVPPIVLPLLFPGEDRAIPWTQRFTTKANLWIFIFSWQGNYFWTHYFYNILGCKYTFNAWRLNDVPFCLYLITHSYFLLYHTTSNFLLRRLWRALPSHRFSSNLTVSVFIAVLCYFVAVMEVFTIQNFPYYQYRDAYAMFVYGSVFYGLYFIVSFPMYLRLDEAKNERWTLGRAAIEAFAACMIVTTLLDAWRLAIGPIYDAAIVKPIIGA